MPTVNFEKDEDLEQLLIQALKDYPGTRFVSDVVRQYLEKKYLTYKQICRLKEMVDKAEEEKKRQEEYRKKQEDDRRRREKEREEEQKRRDEEQRRQRDAEFARDAFRKGTNNSYSEESFYETFRRYQNGYEGNFRYDPAYEFFRQRGDPGFGPGSSRGRSPFSDFMNSSSRDEAVRILGLPRNFTQDELTKAYRTVAKQVHPDVGGSNEAFIKVQKAYETLKKGL